MSYTKEEQREIAETIIKQIGKQALFMIEAKNIGFATVPETGYVYVSMKITGSPLKVSYVRVIYNFGTDLYDVEYLNNKGKLIDHDENIYAEQLNSAIEHHTGLYTRMSGEEKTKEMVLDKGHNSDGTKKTALVPIRKLFNYVGEVYAVHPDCFYYLNSTELTISKKYFSVSHYKTGELIASGAKTIKEAVRMAEERIKAFINERGIDEYNKIIEGHKVLNPFPAKF